MADENPPLWRLIPLAQYDLPAEPTTQTVRNNLRNLMRRLGIRAKTGQEEAVDAREQELQSMPAHLVERAAPEPDWTTGHLQALTETHQSWLDMDEAWTSIRVLVHAPHSHLPQSVQLWASENGCHVIEAPTPQQIVSVAGDWLPQLQAAAGTRWVLPHLERTFLRHQNGLNLLRSWLDWATEQQGGIIVCDSWAWAFLSQTLHLDQILPQVSVLAPFNAHALKRWFRQLADENSRLDYTFRHADSGRLVIGPAENGGGRQDDSSFLQDLAARSRGIPEIAWRIWQKSLLVESAEEVDESVEAKASDDPGKTIWVRPWDQLELPSAQGAMRTHEALVLHALLLHAGLPDSLLPRLLPLMPFEIGGSLQRLQASRLITDSAECRRVTDLGYLGVRDFLHGEGFLTDQL